MKGSKRIAQSESALDPSDSSLRSKRVMAGPPSDAHKAESSRQQLPLDSRRAESSRQHVRALNTQFASWVKSQLENHLDELWEDGVQDYLTHASNILDKFRDVVDWLKANSEKNENVVITNTGAEKTLLSETKNGQTNSQHNANSGSSPEGSTAFQINSQPNANSGSTREGSTASLSSPWSFGLLPNNQKSILPGSQNGVLSQPSILPGSQNGVFSQPSLLFGNQNATPARQDASDDPEDELEKPSSPSVKKVKEQGVLVVHEVKCKVYVKPDNPADKCWKDMGMGQLSIKCKEGPSKATRESKPTVVVRNDAGKVLLNALLYPGIKMNIQKNTITTIFHTLSAENEMGKESVAAARTYLLRLKTEDDTNKLEMAIKDYTPAE